MGTRPTGYRRHGVALSRWHRQDGFVREAVWAAAIIVIVAVIVLDVVSVVNASLAVRQNATDACDQALSTYVQTESTAMAMDSASSFLKFHDAILLKSESKLVSSLATPNQARVTITAAKVPHTYVFHYFESLPWGVGPWFHKVLRPQATESDSS
jgi:hypothetical protein